MRKKDEPLAERVARLEGKVDVMLVIHVGELVALLITLAKILVG